LKLNSGPIVRTLIASLVLLLAIATVGGEAWARGELRVTSTADLYACAEGAQLFDGPDSGLTPKQGDTCVLFPGTYRLDAGPVVVEVPNMTIRSRDGANVTVVDASGQESAFEIIAPNVSIGGTGANEGMTVTFADGPGILITDGFDFDGVLLAANENITIQNNIIEENGAAGIEVDFFENPRNVENFTLLNNVIRNNLEQGIVFFETVLQLGGRDDDERTLIQGNTIELNGESGVHFINAGDLENLKAIDNNVFNNGDNGFFFDGTLGVGAGVTNVSNVLFQGNVIQQNGHLFEIPTTAGAGVLFANSGKVEDVQFLSNKDISGTRLQGITGNFSAGVLFDGEGLLGSLFGGDVGSITNVLFEDNILNDNGNGVEPLNVGFIDPWEGVLFNNRGDVENADFLGNIIRQNGGDGVLLAQVGDYSDSVVRGNEVLNNGTHPDCEFLEFPFCNGFAAVLDGDIDGIEFENNTVSENFFNGTFLGGGLRGRLLGGCR